MVVDKSGSIFDDRRKGDRRKNDSKNKTAYAGVERRKGDRRAEKSK